MKSLRTKTTKSKNAKRSRTLPRMARAAKAKAKAKEQATEPASDTSRTWPDPFFGYVAPQMLRGMLDAVEKSAKSARDCLLSAADVVASSDACAEVLWALGELHKVIETVENTRVSFEAREEVTP